MPNRLDAECLVCTFFCLPQYTAPSRFPSLRDPLPLSQRSSPTRDSSSSWAKCSRPYSEKYEKYLHPPLKLTIKIKLLTVLKNSELNFDVFFLQFQKSNMGAVCYSYYIIHCTGGQTSRSTAKNAQKSFTIAQHENFVWLPCLVTKQYKTFLEVEAAKSLLKLPHISYNQSPFYRPLIDYRGSKIWNWISDWR